MQFSHRLLGASLLLISGFGCAPVSVQESAPEIETNNGDELEIIDLHAHIYPVSSELNDQYIDDLVRVAEGNGVSKVVLGLNARQVPERPPTYSNEHDQWVLRAAERYPDIIVPALNGFDPTDPSAVDYVREQLSTGDWKMIGELDLRNQVKKTTTPADGETLMQIYALAAQADVPVMIHHDFSNGTTASTGEAELINALAGNPQTNFIFAHSCGSNLVELMADYPNLYCEQEFVPPAPGIDLTRVVLGTDMQVHAAQPELAATEYAGLITKLRNSIVDWDQLDQERAANLTPAELLNL